MKVQQKEFLQSLEFYVRRIALILDVIVTHQIFISKQNQSRSNGLSPFVQQLISEEK